MALEEAVHDAAACTAALLGEIARRHRSIANDIMPPEYTPRLRA